MNAFWQKRISRAETNYKAWENQFKCKVLEDYYEGRQWQFNSFFTTQPYVVNLVYSTIKIKAANILLSYPKYNILPKPGNADYNQEFAIQSAQLKEDTLNTIVSDDKEAFANMMHLVFLDSMFRFGVAEVGYASEWVRNPMADRPLQSTMVTVPGKDTEEYETGDKVTIAKYPDELPQNEKIYFKHIPAKRFRVGTRDATELARCDWFGYYEFVHLSDLKLVKGLKSEYLKQSVRTYSEATQYRYGDERPDGDLVKIWHLWDNRAKKRYLALDNPCDILWEDDFKRSPIMDLRWDLRLNGFFPMPPVFQWLSPQNEYNESREMMRSHRKRFLRKFAAVGDDIDQEEVDKFTNGEDGTIVKLPRADSIKAIDNPSLDSSVKDALIVSKDDFNEVSGTSSADRGRADRTTATESQRLGMKADVRDSAEDAIMKRMMARMGREALLCAQERFTEGIWAKLNSDPGEQFLDEVQLNPVYQWISAEKLDDGYDFQIDVEVISASPVKQEEEQGKFVTFLTLCSKFPQIALSPLLVREAAYRSGYRNERVIKEMQRMSQLQMMGAAAQANGGQVPQNQAAQQGAAQITPPQPGQIETQIDNQIQ